MKRLFILFAFAFTFVLSYGVAEAQLTGRQLTFYNELGGTTNIASDTVTNTATQFLTSPFSGGGAGTTSIVVTTVEISGTTGGTLTLFGCNDSCSKTSVTTTNWVRVMQPDTQTAIPTITAADGGGIYNWNVTGSPYVYYRVQFVGAGTGVQTFAAKLMSH